MLCHLGSQGWDDGLLDYFGIPEALLPAIQPSSAVHGETDADALGAPVPIAGIAGDQQAALFGQGCFAPGMMKNTYGTGCFLLVNEGHATPRPPQGLLASAGCHLGNAPAYVLEGAVFVAGAAIQWLRDGLGLIASAPDTEALAASVSDAGGMHFVPAFVGLGAPYWNAEARGALTGLTRGTTRAHIARAALEAIAFQTVELVEAMGGTGPGGRKPPALRVDGGATANSLLLQIQADLLGIPVERPKVLETTAAGAAYLAGLAAGFWSGVDEVSAIREVDRVFEPARDDAWRADMMAGWRKAVQRVLV
jgi:glycerol kinase